MHLGFLLLPTVLCAPPAADTELFPVRLQPVGNGPADIAAADLDADGRADLVVANRSSDDLSVLLAGPRAGEFHELTVATGAEPVALALADFDSSGTIDLAVACAGDFEVRVHLGVGDGSFATGTTLALPETHAPTALVAGDLDDDGASDLVAGTAPESGPWSTKGEVWSWLGIGDGSFGPLLGPRKLGNVAALAAGDFDANGRLDVAVALDAGSAQGLELLKGKGDGTFNAGGSLGLGAPRTDVLTVDVNQDGAVDLVSADGPSDTVSLFIGVGDGTFLAPVAHPVGQDPSGLMATDLDDDGLVEVLAACPGSVELAVLGNLGGGSFAAASRDVVGPIGTLAIVDWSGDGRPDIAATEFLPGGVVALVRNDGGGGFLALEGFDAPHDASGIAAGDLGGDAAADLAVTWVDFCHDCPSYPAGTVTYTGQGDGDFAQALYLGGLSGRLLIADLDGAGRDDLVLAQSCSIAILLALPEGGYTQADVALVECLPYSSVAADLDADGDTDLAFLAGSANDETLQAFLNVGAGTFASPMVTPVRDGAHGALAAGDVNGDGIADLAGARPAQSLSVWLRLGRGDGSFPSELVLPVGVLIEDLALADVDGNGLDDLVGLGRAPVLPPEPSSLFVLLAAAPGSLGPPATFRTHVQGRSLRVVDLDLDGDLDVIAHGLWSRMETLLGRGDGSFARPELWSTGPAGEIEVADVDGDGRPDVLAIGSDGVGATLLNQSGP